MLKRFPKPVRYIVILLLIGFAAWAIIPVFLDKEVSESAPENTQTVTASQPVEEQAHDKAAEGIKKVERELSGTFTGRNGYSAVGTARIIEDEAGLRYVRFDEDFNVDNGPDLIVYIGTENERGTQLGALKGNIGSQNYELPSDLDLSSIDTVRVFCRAFNVDFATASL